MLVSFTFSTMIYRVLASEVERFERAQRFRIEHRILDNPLIPGGAYTLPPLPRNSELLEESKSRILMTLIVINTAIFFSSGALGYILSGKTLKPIGDMVDEQNRFISDASHELRTPLTSLKSAFEVHLRNSNRTLPDADTLVGESITEVNKLQTLSESLLTLAQYQSTNVQTHFERLQVSELLKEAIHKIMPIVKQKKIMIDHAHTSISVYGDRYGLTDLIVILLDNAVKYSPHKSTIDIRTQKTDGHILITVTDHGAGIARSDLPHIFDRFYRADIARSKTRYDGYGLGLSIAKKIASIHTGSITVKSTAGKGSTFTVRLPIRQAA